MRKQHGSRRRIAPAPAQPRPATAAFARGATVSAIVAIVAATVWAYSTSHAGAFVHDDTEAIVTNPHVRSLWPLSRAAAAPRDTTVAGRPVPSLTLALNYALAPADAREIWQPTPGVPRSADPFSRHIAGYHTFNLAVHIGSALFLFGVLRRTLLAPVLRDRFGRAATPLACAIALIWAVHPLQTESVTYIVQRVESLMGFFWLATLYCSIRALEAPGLRRWWIAAAVVTCALGMASKEAMAGAPIFVAFWIWICRPDLKLFSRETRPLLDGLAATWVILAAVLAAAPRSASVGFNLAGWTWWSYLRTQSEVLVHYLRLVFVPRPLVIDYAWLPANSWRDVAPEFALMSLLLAATIAALVKRRPVGLLGAWFFLILAPSSSVLPIATEVAAEHRMYLPLAAVITLVIAMGSKLFPAVESQVVPRVAALIALALVVGLFAELTRARNLVYASNASLTEDTARNRPQNAQARLTHGVDLLRAQRFAEAETELRAALALPLSPGTGPGPTARMHLYLGSALTARKQSAEGVVHLQRALGLDPTLTEGYALLGEALVVLGRPREAVVQFERAVALLPDVPPLLARAAWLLATCDDAGVRDGARAVDYASRAVRLTDGRDIVALDSLAAALAEQGRFSEAIGAIERALAGARAQGQTSVARELEGHLESFRNRRPIRTIGR